MKIIVVANSKGGVAKTTTTLVLAEYLSAKKSYGVLTIDLDQQSGISKLLVRGFRTGHNKIVKDGKTVDHYFMGAIDAETPANLSNFISKNVNQIRSNTGTAPGRMLLISSASDVDDIARELQVAVEVSGEDIEVSEQNKELSSTYQNRARNISEVFRRDLYAMAAADKIDFVLIDTPSGRPFLSDVALWTADLILIPVTPEFLPVTETGRFIELLGKKEDAVGAKFPTPYVLFTRVQNSNRPMIDSVVGGMIEPKIAKRCEFMESRVVQKEEYNINPLVASVVFEERYPSALKAIATLGNELLRLTGDGNPAR